MSGAGPTFYPWELPSRSLFRFPPDAYPEPIPPPFDGPSLKTPFPIPAQLFRDALSFKVPLTIATVYATTVVSTNWYNRRHGNKPWAISKTRMFKAFVILHNVFLAVYSAITCVAMVRALKVSFPHYTERNAFVGTVDALCKINGPRGLGSAATYNPERNEWTNKNTSMHLDASGLPDSTDVGRIWNEGLAFWGWIFYLSKFYEVLDTVIILAKGKRSTTLQTYHHAGAMLCMWAGIRFMSPPIWMFALVNSGIHAMMYTYYTVSALGYRVPQTIKRSLTTLQITQFLVGTAFAAMHLFVNYTVPVSVPYQIVDAVVSKSTVVVSSITASLTSPEALPTVTGAAALLKQFVYRAAGEEGLAENIPSAGIVAGAPQVPLAAPQQNATPRTVYRTEYQKVPCIDTPGEAFAIYLNIIYLAPLTGLFVRFFVKSYIRRTSANTKHATKKNIIAKSTRDAKHGVERELESLGMSAEDGVATGSERPNRGKKSDSTSFQRAPLSPENQKAVKSITERARQRLEEMGEGEEALRQRAKKMAKDIVEKAANESGANGAQRKESMTNGEKPSYAEVVQENDVNGDDANGDSPSYAEVVQEGDLNGHANGRANGSTGGKANGKKANGKA